MTTIRGAFYSLVLMAVSAAVIPVDSATAGVLNFEPYGFTLNYPDSWIEPTSRYQNAKELHSIARINGSAAQLLITVEQRLDHDDATERLRQIDAEEDTPATFLDIDGWPALQRHVLVPASEPGLPDPGTGRELVWKVTTAVAVDDLLVRVQGLLQPEADSILIDEMEAIGRSLRFSVSSATDSETTLDQLRQAPRIIQELPVQSTRRQQLSSSTPVARSAADSGLNLRVNAGNGVDSEIEIAASTDGRHIVVANNSRDYQTSNDGGLTRQRPLSLKVLI